MSRPLVLDLNDDVTGGLESLASRHGRSARDLAAEAVGRFVAEEMAEIAGIERALDDMRHGRVVPHDDVVADIRRLLEGGQGAAG